MPPLRPKQTMPVPAPTAPSLTSSATRGGNRPARVGRLDLDGARVVQPAVVAFADDRDHDVVDADGRIGLDRRGDRTVEDAPDRHRRREIDRRLDQPPLRDLQEAGQLARAVQHRGPGRAPARGRGCRPGRAGSR